MPTVAVMNGPSKFRLQSSVSLAACDSDERAFYQPPLASHNPTGGEGVAKWIAGNFDQSTEYVLLNQGRHIYQ